MHVLSFFLGTVLPTMLEEEESVNAVRQLTEQFDEVRRKKTNFVTFSLNISQLL